MPPARRSTRAASSHAAREATHPYTRANRPRSPASSARPTASIARPANGKTSLRLTVKAPPSKLRQATSGSQIAATIPPNPYADHPSDSDATPQPATRTARSTRNPRTVVEPESEEDEEEEDEEEEDEPDDEGEDVEHDVAGNEESEEEVEAEDDDDGEDEDDDMEDELQSDHPPPPIIRQERPLGKIKPNVTVTAPPEGPLKSVEDKEMDDIDNASDEEEEDLSELDSDSNENGEDEDDEDDSDADNDNDMSRSATPDLSKLTRRQRGAYEEATDPNLLSLSNEAQKKKHLTAEEHAMRRAEMARRRKNLSEKRNEEEKMDTINKLLKKPAPKRRTRAEIIAQQQAESMATPGAEEGEEERPDALFVRWVNTREGSRIGVPEEWLEGPLAGSFGLSAEEVGGRGRMMVEEVA